MRNFLLIGLALFALGLNAQDATPEMQNEMDSLSYFLGLSLGYELKQAPFEANPDLILQGFTGAFQGEAAIDEAKARQVFQELQMALQKAERQKAEADVQDNLDEGSSWLEENGKREGVFTTPSGLQYEIITKGEGPMPADTSEVRVHYEGKLVDGTVFDSSFDRGEPISFPLNRVIPGWTEGLQLMHVGSTHTLFIPPDLGYGERGSGPIPPNSVLIFKVELLGIE